MLSSIWTQCAGDSELRTLRLTAWRVVESQHHISTRKLVDSAEEQSLLESLIEQSKPPDSTRGRLHYLLFTPFRYPPLRHGSRFGARHERGIWYGSETRHTAFAEVAYYRLLFIAGSHADFGTVRTPLTAFTVRMHTDHGVDLIAHPFADFRAELASPTRYGATQALGAAMRNAGVEMFRFASARDTASHAGANVGAFVPQVFGTAKPRNFEAWHCYASTQRVEFTSGDFLTKAIANRETCVFEATQFMVDGVLPMAAG